MTEKKSALAAVIGPNHAAVAQEIINELGRVAQKSQTSEEALQAVLERLGKLEAAHQTLAELVHSQDQRIPNVPELSK